MKKETATTLRAFVIELAVYAVLVIGYFLRAEVTQTDEHRKSEIVA